VPRERLAGGGPPVARAFRLPPAALALAHPTRDPLSRSPVCQADPDFPTSRSDRILARGSLRALAYIKRAGPHGSPALWQAHFAPFSAAASGSPAFVVALDPGHGRIQPRGAHGQSRTVREKHLTLDIARLVQRRLQGEPGLKIVLLPDQAIY